ncbi:HK97 family phage prohead protease [Saccharothrix texasensis]|uniref:HK97 family phage prohead protease n=1 Tax=Saccharothrix texasensis TaxID=103734 RepID=A0A3N1H4M9_9PSEU|nr:HK97 family phage prohead protease [Saccharothrix texasensis]ROP37441.1 HK97 family phage prohead protease [Saccharothrix texasensis]
MSLKVEPRSATSSRRADVEPSTGVVEVLAAVTGVRDDTGDVIEPGAFTRTLKDRRPKVVLSHDWNRPVGKTLAIRELMPGDPRLPRTTHDGRPWPKGAGALWARYQANLETDDGRKSFVDAKFFGPEAAYSIGYAARRTRQVGGTRHIEDLDLFEYGPVLHGANTFARLLATKGGPPSPLEVKVVGLRAGGPSSRSGRARLSRAELAEVRELRASVEELYAEALADDVPMVADADGVLRPARCAVCREVIRGGGGGRFGSTFYCAAHDWRRA